MKVSKEKLSKTIYTNGLIINSGNANACTWKKSYHNVERIAEMATKLLQVPTDNVLVASTGSRIGLQMPM